MPFVGVCRLLCLLMVVMAALKLVTLNCHGLRDQAKQDLLAAFFTLVPFDILFLQETHVTDGVEGDALARRYDCLGHWSFGTPPQLWGGYTFSYTFVGHRLG